MLDKIYKEAIDELIENIPVWQIPKYKYEDYKTGKTMEEDIDDWQSYCMFDEDGDYSCPEGFYLKTTYDGDEYHPTYFNKIFKKRDIYNKVLDISKEYYPDVYNELLNNIK